MARSPEFPRPNILAHRMMVMGYPENTILALQQAINLGVDWVEFDVKVLADGTMVSMHDSDVDRTTDGHGNITKMTYAEVKKLNAGKGYNYGFVPVPTVEDIVKVISKSPRLLKAEMHIHNLYEPEPLVELLAKYKVQDRCYFNLNAAIVGDYMRNEMHDNKSLLSLNVGGDTPELKDLCEKLHLSYLCVTVKQINSDFVDRIHHFRKDHPVFVHCYPVQTEDLWRKMLEAGVDVIQTDYPEALMEFLETQKV